MARPARRRAVALTSFAAASAGVDATLVARLQQSQLFHDYRQAFEDATGLPLVLREAGSFRTPLEGSKLINPFCVAMTQANKTCAACLQFQQRLEEQALLKPATLPCHAGLHETAVPVRVGNRVIAFLQTGQVSFRGRPLGAGIGPTRSLDRKHYDSLVRLLAIFADHLATVSNQMMIAQTVNEPPVITRARSFIAAHQGENLSLADAARAVNMDACYFCKVFRKGTGLVFTEYLARARVEAVKRLLLNVHTRVSEACYASGFQSLSQFNRVFHRVAGEAPSSYRDRIHGLNGSTRRPAALAPAA
jgi:AraC-like DNA-binding protein/ligand-binding sensor protein